MACSIIDTCIGCTACAKICPTHAITGERDKTHCINPDLCIECESCGRVCPSESVLTEDGQVIKRLKKKLWLKPRIIVENCVACENCVGVCPTQALGMKSEQLPLTENWAVLLAPNKCISCNWCLHNCQYDAIIMEVLA